jgi:hypothetical protein
MEMSMSALDMANEDDLAARLRVEPNESFDGKEEETSRLRVFVDVSCFMGCNDGGWCVFGHVLCPEGNL